MRVLGIDTSGYANAIGIADGDRILADSVFEARTDSLQKIILNIDYVLESVSLRMKDIDGLGVGLGPGSWTGIRIGVTVGKMLAYSTGKPVYGVSTFEALAYQAGNSPSMVCPIINAGAKNTIYASFYRTENGVMRQAGEHYAGDINGLAEKLKEPVLFIGPEAKSYNEQVRQSPGFSGIETDAVEDVPRGGAIALLAAGHFNRGEKNDVLSLAPMYLKESTARAFVGRYTGSVQEKG